MPWIQKPWYPEGGSGSRLILELVLLMNSELPFCSCLSTDRQSFLFMPAFDYLTLRLVFLLTLKSLAQCHDLCLTLVCMMMVMHPSASATTCLPPDI